MGINYKISAKKQALIDEKNNSPIRIGEHVVVSNTLFRQHLRNGAEKGVSATVVNIDGDMITVQEGDCSVVSITAIINKSEIIARDTRNIGANRFAEDLHDIRFVAFSLESILFQLQDENKRINSLDDFKNNHGETIRRANWNPYVIDKDGNKIRYQRPFVWTLEQKQLLVESIYMGIDCGKILVRKRSLKFAQNESGSDSAFNDIVDGKQRLNAIIGFINCNYPDMNGDYFNDLSAMAQWRFTDHMLFSYAEMAEGATDEKVIRQFLKLNHTGVPQSKEHIEFVKSIVF